MTAPRVVPDPARERAWWLLWERLLRPTTDTPVAMEQPASDRKPAPAPETDAVPAETVEPA